MHGFLDPHFYDHVGGRAKIEKGKVTSLRVRDLGKGKKVDTSIHAEKNLFYLAAGVIARGENDGENPKQVS